MALGTKDDGHLSIIYIQAIIQSKLHFSYSQSLDKRAKIKLIFVPAISTLYLFIIPYFLEDPMST